MATEHKIPTVDEWVNGKSFSPDDAPRPESPKEHETYREYRRRVDKCVEKGFHLGDLPQSNWETYCMGSGHFDGVNADELIFKKD